MTPKDLKPGYLVKFSDGKYGTVQYHRWGLSTPDEDAELTIVVLENCSRIRTKAFKVSMLDDKFEGSDKKIMAVYGYSYFSWQNKMAPEDRLTNGRTLLWERKEPKKMTVADVCKALGYDVEIVKDGATDA